MSFSHPDLAAFVQDRFEPAWERVRAVPRVTIDFGGGPLVAAGEREIGSEYGFAHGGHPRTLATPAGDGPGGARLSSGCPPHYP